MALVAGGLIAAVTFVPFTLAHGPTSYNVEREVLGWDMLRWGLLLGTVPHLLVGVALWRLRGSLSDRRVTSAALAAMCVAMAVFAALNLGFGGIGPPFDLFFLAPASVVVASTTRLRGLPRAVLGALAVAYCTATAIALIPLETQDGFGGYRMFGLVAYAGVGALWAMFGTVLPQRERARS